MKVLFLDIDGVLNDQHYVIHNETKRQEQWLDPAKMDILNQLIARDPEIKIVMSTAWRFMGCKRLSELFLQRGAEQETVDAIIGRTERHHQGYRGLEISDWLEAHPETTRFAIIDDETVDILGHVPPFTVVKTYWAPVGGITEAHADHIFRILNSDDRMWESIQSGVVYRD